MGPAGYSGDGESTVEIWPPGTQVTANHRIIRNLGRGGFGAAYLASHRFLPSLWVIKRLKTRENRNADAAGAMVREARIALRFKNCPNIVATHDVTASNDGYTVIVMEYFDGKPLDSILGTATLPVATVIEYGRQIAAGLEAVHTGGVVHRDVKPGNILIGKNDRGQAELKLFDFGIAVDLDSTVPCLDAGGTPRYASPEQRLLPGKDLDGRSDLYSLGVTMYRLLCGHVPNSVDEVHQYPQRWPSDSPQWLKDLVTQLLSPDRENRPPNAAAVVAHLSAREPDPGEIRIHPKDGLPYVYIPPGTFRMGDDKDGPPHDVTLTKGFWMTQTPVTVAAYKRFCQATGTPMPDPPFYDESWNRDTLPMTMVSWHDAEAYCKWAALRLPTEAEWEYAARAGTTGPHYGKLDDIAWYNCGSPQPVGQKLPNELKLHDMLGNVWEWIADWHAPYKGAAIDPTGPPNGDFRVLRGGSWYSDASVVRASNRLGDLPMNRNNNGGFRCVGETLVL